MRLALAAVSLAAIALTAPAAADTLIDNVDGLTLTADGTVQRFAGLLVDDNGRVQQLFQRGDKRPIRVDYRLDAKNRVLMPGLIDSHVALMPLALSRSAPLTPGARPRPEDRDQALIDIQKLLLERGITAVTDMGTTIADWQAYRRAGDAGTLALRILAYAGSADDMVLIAGPRPTPWLYDDRLRLNGLNIAFNAAPAMPARVITRPARAAPASPAHQAAATRGPEPSIQLKNLLSRAGIDQFHPAVTLAGASSTSPLLDAIGELALTYKGERRWRIDTSAMPGEAELARMAQNGAALVLLPGAMPQTGAPPLPLQGAVRLRYAFGLGSNAALPQPFTAFSATLRREDAFAAMTSNAAWAAFADGRIGRIAIGQRADFILVDRDPLLAGLADLRDIKVLQTWVGGRMVYRAAEESAPRPAAAPLAEPDR